MQKIRLFSLSVFVCIFIGVGCLAHADVSVKSNDKNISFKDDGPNFSRVWTVTVVLLALVAAGAYFTRKHYGPFANRTEGSGKNIEVIESRRLSTRTVMYLVKVRNRSVLLVESADGVKIIDVDTSELGSQPE